MNLHLALLVSSQRQAESFITHPGLSSYPDYRLLVTNPQNEAATLAVFRVSYPDKAPGKGWSDPVYPAAPHRAESFSTLTELDAFLTAVDVVAEGWKPVEREP